MQDTNRASLGSPGGEPAGGGAARGARAGAGAAMILLAIAAAGGLAASALLGCSARADKAAAFEAAPAMDSGFAPEPLAAKSLAAPAPAGRGAELAKPAAQTAPPPAAEASGGAAGGAASPLPKERKLVRSAWLRLRVAKPAEAAAKAEALVRGLGGYVASSRASEDSYGLSLRVPQARLDEALSGLAPLGTLLSKTENSEDVTLRYYDLEGRLETKRELAATFRGYLKSAKSIEDIMAVETRLAELQNEIEWMGSELRGLADLVDFSSLELELLPPAAAVSGGGFLDELGERLGSLFVSFGSFVAALLAGIVGFLVYGLPLLGLLILLAWLLFGRVGLLRRLWARIGPRGKRGE